MTISTKLIGGYLDETSYKNHAIVRPKLNVSMVRWDPIEKWGVGGVGGRILGFSRGVPSRHITSRFVQMKLVLRHLLGMTFSKRSRGRKANGYYKIKSLDEIEKVIK